MKLNYEIVEVCKLSQEQKKEMFSLFELHYANAFWNDFISDLSEKQWVILLFSLESKQLAGFSTQLCIIPETGLGFDDSLVIYSGDTIIAHEYWGSVTLPVAFLDLVSKIRSTNSGKKIYWMLISKGFRTFKFLTVFLNEYYPNPKTKTPQSIFDLMHYLGKRKFGNKYKPELGIIEATDGGQFLKKEFQPEENLESAVAKFFYASNSGYYKGDELLCLAEISDSNLHPFIKRIVSRHA